MTGRLTQRTSSLIGIALLVVGVLAGVGVLSLARPHSARAASSPETSCSWPVKNDPDAVNAAWPDEDASYWAAPFYSTPNTEVTIRGAFPLARYMSFHVYEGGAAVSKVTDYQIDPSRGINPYRPGARRTRGGSYVLHLVYGQTPADPPPNTLYAASLNGEPNVSGVMIYRLYLPQGDGTGDEPLPQVSYTNATSGAALPCPSTSALDSSSLNQRIVAGSLPTDTSSAPKKDLSWGVVNAHTSGKQRIGTKTVKTNYDGYFGNLDNAYLSLETYRKNGAVLAFRAKAPSFAQTAGARRMPAGQQARYWSVCSDEFATTRYIACVDDARIHVARDGYFTIVMSDAAHKPDNLTSADTWLPEGPFPDEFVLYRQLLATPTFSQSVANAASNATAPKSMGDYYPETVQCSEKDFEKNRCGLPNDAASNDACAQTSGRLSGDVLGPVRLGLDRARERRRLPHYRVMVNRRFDDICLSSGAGIRIGYRATRPRAIPVAVLAMTANAHFSLDGIRRDTTLAAALHRLGPHVSGPFRRGLYRWYGLTGARSTFLIKTADRKVLEIGIAWRKLTRTAAEVRRLLSVLHA